ncbi:TMEM175 family protein [Ktedonobacter robiniae]|uniref:Membrane protein n=1 Tax=Ktedonobacter robiniae TaxID=2778365 RepID=A0ABQ3UXL5_9CHLR|nr:TMEM175 family protein [Ktedonobacter robiniae]GHO57399.1 membrane protein [Ktedonobacter robiniae]
METRQPSRSKNFFEEKSLGFDRLIMLCDGIFAIAMTLLVLDIKLPEGANLTGEEWDKLLTKSIFYLITFITVAGYWVSHRQLMTYIKRQDGPFTSLTFLFLAFVVFFPASFNVLVVSKDSDQVVVFYTLVLACCGFSSFFLWAYASWKRRLIDPELSRHIVSSRSLSLLISPVYFCLSLALLAIPNIDPNAVFYSWVLLPVIARIVHAIGDRVEKSPDHHSIGTLSKQKTDIPVAGK